MASGKLMPFDFAYCSDKTKVFENYCKYTFTRTQSMFTYEGLPDTIPVQWLESYLQRNGSCCIAEHDGKLYALLGNAGGELDEYYQPTMYTVANPALNLSKTFKIGEDCVYCRNDYDAIGLVPLISRYCGLMTENLLTVRISDINMRMMNLLSASDDNTLESTKHYLKDLEEGKLGVVGETPFFDGLKLQSKGFQSSIHNILKPMEQVRVRHNHSYNIHNQHQSHNSYSNSKLGLQLCKLSADNIRLAHHRHYQEVHIIFPHVLQYNKNHSFANNFPTIVLELYQAIPHK